MKRRKGLKPLIPSLRENKRYLVYEVISKQGDVFPSMQQAFLRLFGEHGLAQAGLKHLADKFNKKTHRGILKVNHTSVDRLRASFIYAPVRSVGVSGILNKAEKKFM